MKKQLQRIVAPSISTLIVFGSLAGGAMAQSFVNWDLMSDGDDVGSGTWDGYGVIDYQFQWKPGSNGMKQGSDYPITNSSTTPDVLNPWGMTGDKAWLGVVAGSSGEPGDIGYTLTYKFSDGMGGNIFPATNPNFLIRDVDHGDFIVRASIAGVDVDTSNWYAGIVQTATPEWAAANPTQGYPGSPSYWDASTSTLVGQGQSALWVHQFRPTSVYDTLTFEYTGGSARDGISFAIGDVTVVPEPSFAILLGLGGLGLLARCRK